jgi:hypothetical protein
MKSKLDEAKVQTSCKDCLFAKYEGNTQVDCMAGRLSLFGDSVVEVYDDEKEFCVITRACNMFRLVSWNEGKVNLNKAREECKATFSIIVKIDGGNSKWLDKILSELCAVAYDKEKIQIIISQPSDADHNVAFWALERLESAGFNPTITKSLHPASREFDCIHQCKGLYISYIPISQKQRIPTNAFSKIDDIINQDLKTPAVIDVAGCPMILTVLAFTHYLEYKNYDSLIEAVSKEALEEDKYIKINE